MKTLLLAGSISVALAGSVLALGSIQLPSGTVFNPESLEAHPKWRESFPKDHAFYVEKYPSGNLKGIHAREAGRLDGPSASLHENGKLKTLANYPHGVRQDAFRMWDEDRRMLLYSQYKDGRKDGVTCLLRDGLPCLIQEWKKGDLESESVVVSSNGKAWKIIDDPKQLNEAKKKLSDVEEALAEAEKNVRKNLRQWFEEEEKRVKEENVKVVKPVIQAQAKVSAQNQRKTEIEAERLNAAAVAAAHPHSRVGRGASAIAGEYKGAVARRVTRSADKDVMAANRNANATAGEAKNALHKRDAVLAKEYEKLYEFALAALEKSDVGHLDAEHKQGKKGRKR